MKSKKIIEPQYIEKIYESESINYSEWFGYYNYDPLNYNHSKLLCNRITTDGVSPTKDMKIELGFYDISLRQWNHIAYTDSWNWQQGAMLQWLPGCGNENKVIFNCSRDNHNVATIIDVITKEQKCLDWSIYAITPDGRKSISLEMERSHWCRAYHYKSVSNKEWDGNIVEADGIFEIDLECNTRKRIISIQDIISIDARPYFSKCKHWVEHIMINPSGTKFCFLHRFSAPDNVFHYKTRLFIANIDGSNLKIIPDWEYIDRTHFGWKADNEFAIYSYTKYYFTCEKGIKEIITSRNLFDLFKYAYNRITSLLPYSISSIINGHHTYYHIYKIDNDNAINASKKIESEEFKVDGHPSFTNDGRYMITDSYPWKDGCQRLMIHDCVLNKTITLNKLFAFYSGNPASCDLHPKLSSDNNYITVDSAYNDKHHIIVYKVNWENIQSKDRK